MNEILKSLGHVLFKMPKGFAVTLKHFFKKPVTLDYPHKKKPMHPRYKGRHYLERLLKMLNQLDTEIIAEDVGSEEDLRVLEDLGIEYVSGPLFASTA